MALTIGDRPVHPLTADDVLAMVDAGVLGEHDRVELLLGVLTEMSPQDPPHAVVTQRLTRWLAPLMVAGTHDVRVQLPFRVPDDTSLPEPDVAVVARDDARVDHPREALFVIEVADSSVRVDTVVKPPLYAAAGVPDYWVVDVAGRRVEIFEGPAADGYRHRRVVDAGVVRPRSVDVAPLVLSELFAGL
jgi:Uma2 family endonuclease